MATAAYKITTMTSQRSAVKGIDLTMKRRNRNADEAAEGEADRHLGRVSVAQHEAGTRHRHQKCSGAHHDGESRGGIHSQQPDECHAGRIEANTERADGAKHSIREDGEQQLVAGEAQCIAAGRETGRAGA